MPQLALIVNLEVKDTHEEAASGAGLALRLCRMVRGSSADDMWSSLCFMMHLLQILVSAHTWGLNNQNGARLLSIIMTALPK